MRSRRIAGAAIENDGRGSTAAFTTAREARTVHWSTIGEDRRRAIDEDMSMHRIACDTAANLHDVDDRIAIVERQRNGPVAIAVNGRGDRAVVVRVSRASWIAH